MTKEQVIRRKVIIVRPMPGRATAWTAVCGDCGRTAVKPYRSKDAAVKAANRHGTEAHAGEVTVKVRPT